MSPVNLDPIILSLSLEVPGAPAISGRAHISQGMWAGMSPEQQRDIVRAIYDEMADDAVRHLEAASPREEGPR